MVQRRAARLTLSRCSTYDSVARARLDSLDGELLRTGVQMHGHGLASSSATTTICCAPTSSNTTFKVTHTGIHTNSHCCRPLQVLILSTPPHPTYPPTTTTPTISLAIVQWNRLSPNIALLPDLEAFRLAASRLTYSMPKF